MLQRAGTPKIKRNIDKLEAVQCRPAKFVLNFNDYRQSADPEIFTMAYIATP